MKIIRIGNDIQLSWTITRFSEPEDFSNKNVSVSLIDKFNKPQVFNYSIDDNVVHGIFYGKDQSTNGTYRLLLTENAGEVDMITLDYIDCFCLSNKLKNQTSNGSDATSAINTEVVEISSNIDTTIDLSNYATKEWVEDKHYLTEHQDISGKANVADLSAVATSGSYNDLTNKPAIPANTSDLNNDSNFVSDASYVHTDNNFSSEYKTILDNYEPEVQADWNESDSSDAAYIKNKPVIPVVPTNVSSFTNDAGYLTSHQDISGKANVSDLATVATSGSYNDLNNKPSLFSGSYDDLTNKPTIPVVPSNVSSFTNDAGYLTQHQTLKTINNQSIVGSGNITIESGSGSQVEIIEFTGGTTGQLTDEQYDKLDGDNCIVKYENRLYQKAYTSTSGFDYRYIGETLTNEDVSYYYFTVSRSTKQYTFGTTIDSRPRIIANPSNPINATPLTALTVGFSNYTVPQIPTNVSSFTNDAGYITSHQDISGKANTADLGSAAYLDVPSSGNASSTEIVLGNDSRLSDARTPVSHTHTVSEITDFPASLPASDVSSWAKASTKPSYSYSEISGTPSLATVATSGSYNDLSNKPTIPTQTSQLTNNSNFIVSADFTSIVSITQAAYDALVSGGTVSSTTIYIIQASNS